MIIESDFLSAISLIREDSPVQNEVANWLADVRMLSENFSAISFHHVFWESNSTAHCLAKESFKLGRALVWLSVFPPFLCRCAKTDFHDYVALMAR